MTIVTSQSTNRQSIASNPVYDVGFNTDRNTDRRESICSQIETIIGQRSRNGLNEFLVKWKGHPNKPAEFMQNPSWEPSNSIADLYPESVQTYLDRTERNNSAKQKSLRDKTSPALLRVSTTKHVRSGVQEMVKEIQECRKIRAKPRTSHARRRIPLSLVLEASPTLDSKSDLSPCQRPITVPTSSITDRRSSIRKTLIDTFTNVARTYVEERSPAPSFSSPPRKMTQKRSSLPQAWAPSTVDGAEHTSMESHTGHSHDDTKISHFRASSRGARASPIILTTSTPLMRPKLKSSATQRMRPADMNSYKHHQRFRSLPISLDPTVSSTATTVKQTLEQEAVHEQAVQKSSNVDPPIDVTSMGTKKTHRVRTSLTQSISARFWPASSVHGQSLLMRLKSQRQRSGTVHVHGASTTPSPRVVVASESKRDGPLSLARHGSLREHLQNPFAYIEGKLRRMAQKRLPSRS